MVERRLTRASAVAVHRAVEEAAARGDRRIGTDHLLLGLLHDPEAGPTQALGIGSGVVRTALDALDRDALAAVGIDTGELLPLSPVRSTGHRPFTAATRAVLQRAVAERGPKRRRVEPNHLLAALLDTQRPDVALDVLDRIGVDQHTVRGRIAGAGDGRA